MHVCVYNNFRGMLHGVVGPNSLVHNIPVCPGIQESSSAFQEFLMYAISVIIYNYIIDYLILCEPTILAITDSGICDTHACDA